MGALMKFLLQWRVHEDKRHELLKVFAAMTAEDDKVDTGPNIQLIGRWFDLAGGTGVAIAETDDALALANFALNWNSGLDIEVTPVLDDAEARKVGRARDK
jgi:Domain of unknown function (DUF3303)